MTATPTFPDDVPTLTDGVITLRAHQLGDADQVLEQATDPDSVAWTVVPVPYTANDAVAFVTRMMPEGWTTRTELAFAIEAEHPDGVPRFAGTISLRPRGDGVAEIAYGLHPAVRGRGVCSRAVKLLVDWGFTEAGFDVIVWYAEVGNWASRRVVWANGFTFDGMIPRYVVQRGHRKDAWVGSLRASDGREPKHPWNVPPVLETDRLRLRPFADADADRLDETLVGDRSRHFGGRVRQMREVADGPAALLRIREANAIGSRIDWCIADRETDLLLGHLQLFDLGGLDDTEVKPGYTVHKDARGHGVLTEALDAVVNWVFGSPADGGFGKRRITIITAASNTASRAAAEKVGFTHISTEPEAFTIGDDGFDDKVIYHRINDAWRPAWTRSA